MLAILNEQRRDNATSLICKKSGDQKYLFLCDHLYVKMYDDQNYPFPVMTCILNRLRINATFFW